MSTDIHAPFDVQQIREDFPALQRQVYGRPLVYLDNGATSHKPRAVLDAMDRFHTQLNSNVHRGVHCLSQEATKAFEDARELVRGFINARRTEEIIFTRGTTESINLVAASWGQSVQPGDEVLITHMEHHSNIVPWQMLCERTGAQLKVVPMNSMGELDMDAFDQLLSPRTRLLACVHISNALGTINPVGEMTRRAHENGTVVLIDGAQSVPHMAVDVQALDADFFAFSGHKMFGPTGIGVLYGKKALLESMPPWQGGGDMIKSVSFEKTTYNDLPYKFEAGTPAIAEAIGLGAAVTYLNALGLDRAAEWEKDLLDYATERIQTVPGIRIVGTARDKASVLAFTLDGVHPHDVGTILDRDGVAVRAGHHCAQPVMTYFKVPATVRASFAFYNTRSEVDALIDALRKVQELFA